MHTHIPISSALSILCERPFLFLPPMQPHTLHILNVTMHLSSPTCTHMLESINPGGRVALYTGEGREEELFSRGMTSSRIVRDYADVEDDEHTNSLFDSARFSPFNVSTKLSKPSPALSAFPSRNIHPLNRPTLAFDRERTRSGKTMSVLVERTPPLVLG